MPPHDGLPVRLVEKRIDHDAIAQLAMLLDRAEQGEIVGIAWIALADEGGVAVGFSGAVSEHLYTSIGAVRALERDLLDLIEPGIVGP